MGNLVNKSDYQVVEYNSGYYGICKTHYGAGRIFGGDSADEDNYNRDYIEEVYNSWNGELDEDGFLKLN